MFGKKNSRCYDMGNMMWQALMTNTAGEYMTTDKKFEGKKECGIKPHMEPQMCCDPMPGCKMQPVYECPVEKCVHRTICHEIPHVCPVNTKVINHHVYRHTYSPCYTCCEENEICHVNEESCCCFR